MFEVIGAACARALLVLAVTASAAPGDSSIVYTFENERFNISRIEMRLEEGGAGQLVFTRKGLAKPIEREFRVSPEAMAELWASLERIGFLGSTEDYQSKGDHSNLGTVTLAATRDGKSRQTTFNYSSNREVWTLAATLRGVANREIFAFDLETALKYQPLETPALLDSLKKEVAGGRISDPGLLVPLLREIAEDFAVPLIARNRAGELAEKIEKNQARSR